MMINFNRNSTKIALIFKFSIKIALFSEKERKPKLHKSSEIKAFSVCVLVNGAGRGVR